MEIVFETKSHFDFGEPLNLEDNIAPCPEDSCDIINNLLDTNKRDLEVIEILNRNHVLRDLQDQFKYASKKEIKNAILVLTDLL